MNGYSEQGSFHNAASMLQLFLPFCCNIARPIVCSVACCCDSSDLALMTYQTRLLVAHGVMHLRAGG